jgi:3'-5' exonuclease
MKDQVILSSSDFDFLISGLEEAEYVALDTETTVDDLRDGRGYCLGTSLSFPYSNELQRGRVSTYLPLRHAIGDNYGPVQLTKLKQVIESQDLIIFHHARHDLFSLATIGT